MKDIDFAIRTGLIGSPERDALIAKLKEKSSDFYNRIAIDFRSAAISTALEKAKTGLVTKKNILAEMDHAINLVFFPIAVAFSSLNSELPSIEAGPEEIEKVALKLELESERDKLREEIISSIRHWNYAAITYEMYLRDAPAHVSVYYQTVVLTYVSIFLDKLQSRLLEAELSDGKL